MIRSPYSNSEIGIVETIRVVVNDVTRKGFEEAGLLLKSRRFRFVHV